MMKRNSNGTIVRDSRVPTLNLSEIKSIAESQEDDVDEENNIKMCNTIGFFLYENNKKFDNSNKYWTLGDAHLPDGYDKIKLVGAQDKYPKPLPGDIVRIHRLCFDTSSRCSYIPTGKNVILWRSFVHIPQLEYTSERPTISDVDESERRKLELVYSNYRTPLEHLRDNTFEVHKKFFKIAGRVESKEISKFNHLIIHVNDGTAIAKLRLFAKSLPFESSDHYDLGLKLKDGDYIIVSNAKRNTNDPQLLDLSANFDWGRSLRIVEAESILGVKLSEKLQNQPINNNDVEQSQLESNKETFPVAHMPRRSPRLNPQNQNTSSPIKTNAKEPFPNFTRISDIKKREINKYEFCDLVGRVRGEPKEASDFNNYYFLLSDGSKFKYCNYHEHVFSGQPIEDCIVVLVYSPQRSGDVDDHIEKAKTLKDDDFILIKNIKTFWREGGKVEFILHPNTRHDKGITIIDKESDFGMYLKEKLIPLDEPELSET